MSMQKPLVVTVISAQDLKDVNILSRMEVYAVVWLSNNPRIRHRTPTDRKGGKSPSWNNTTFQFFVPDGPIDGLVLHFLLRCERSLGDRDVGEVHVPVKDVLSSPASGKSPQFVSYAVRRPSGKSKGALNLSFKVGEPVAATTHVANAMPYVPPVGSYPAPGVASAYPAPAKVSGYPPVATAPAYVAPPPASSSKADVPITAYPAGPSSAYPAAGAAAPYPHTGYPPYPPPPHQPYVYGAPPPQGGYPPPPAYGYGQPPVAQPQQPKKNKFGMGLGAGLLGGALGGLLIGDMISDAGAYDAGYDAGFDDAFF